MRKTALMIAAFGLAALLAAFGLGWPARSSPGAGPVAADSDLKRLLERSALEDAARRAALAADWPAARDALRRLAALEEGALGEVTADTYLRLGRLERDAGDPAAARSALERASPAGGWRAAEARVLLAALEHPPAAEGRRLAREAARLYEAGSYQEALKRAAQAREWLPAGPDRAEASLLWGLTSLERAEGLPSAKERLLRAREELLQVYGQGHPLEAECVCGLARLEEERGQFIPAESGYTEAMQLVEQSLGAETPAYARLQRRLAHLFTSWWIADGQAMCLRALHLRTRIVGKQHPDYAESLIDLGRINLDYQQEAIAIEVLERAVKLLEAGRGKDHPALAEALCRLGQAHTRRGEFTQARLAFRRALRIAEQAHGKQHPAYARPLVHFADLVGNPECDDDRARRMTAEATGVYRASGCTAHPDYAFALLQEGDTYQGVTYTTARRDYARAGQLLRASLSAFERMPAGKLLPTYVLAASRAANVGYWDNYRARSIDESEGFLKQAGSALRDQQGSRDDEGHPFYVHYVVAKIRIHIARGESEQAIEAGRKVVEVLRKRHGTALHYHSMLMGQIQALTLLRSGRPAEAMPYIEEGLRQVELMARQMSGQAECSRLAFLTYYHHALSTALTATVDQRRELTPSEATKLYQATLNYRGLVGARQAEDRAAFDQPRFRPHLKALRTAREQLVRHLVTPPGPNPEPWGEELARLTDVKEDLEADLARESTAAPGNRELLDVTARDVQARIPPEGVLIDYVQYLRLQAPPPGRVTIKREASLGAFVARRTGDAVYVDLGPAAPIQEAVDAWRAAIAARPGAPDLDQAGARLARLVWAPLAEHVGTARTVLVAPEGPLCAVPFAALPGQRSGNYLIDEHVIGYVPSSRWIVDRAEHRPIPHARGLLAVGDIAYGRGVAPEREGQGNALFGDSDWEPLPGTGREIEGARKHFTAHSDSGARLLRGEVTKRVLLGALDRRFEHIHFAGHGYFADRQAACLLRQEQGGPDEAEMGLSPQDRQTMSRSQQLLSGLVLSVTPGAATAEGGHAVLTAEEVGSLDLRGTRMVVLSACDTGLGNVANNEGALGLHRAFLNAGVGSVVTSLWKVDDEATAVLMEEFYRNLWGRKMPRLEALRQAQRTLMSDPKFGRHARAEVKRGPRLKPLPLVGAPPAKGRGAHPAFWAAFVLGGQWD